jgi:SAM-dependent methyltransferase
MSITPSEQQQIWDHYQSNTPHLFDENYGRLSFLAKKIATGERVLDIGVGNGIFERLALQRNALVYALDPSVQTIKNLQSELNLGERACVGSITQIPFPDNTFDTIVVSEVLEHLDDITLHQAIVEIARTLRPGGRILGTVPAREELSSSLVVCPHCAVPFHRWGHLQSFTPERIIALLSPFFTSCTAHEYKFITWSRRSFAAKVLAVLKLSARWFGVRLPDESIFFSGVKPTE